MDAMKTAVDIPFQYRKLFEHYDSFNTIQSTFLEDLLHTDTSVVLSAPTGSGKTVAFELAIIRMLECHRQQHQPERPPPKAIYVAPIKALCSEKFLDWKARFESLNVVQITGDSDGNDPIGLIRGAQLIVTTPEKWDSLTRRWRECPEVMGSIQLFIVDEVHLLNEDVRGPILEAIVSRMKTMVACDSAMRLRFVIASATIPNIEDLTTWIGNSNNSANGVRQFVFTDMQRPVPLEKHILGVNSKLKGGFQFDMSLNYKLHDILRKYSEGKATLIFCNSRKSSEMAAAVLQKSTNLFPLSDQQKANLLQLTQRLHDAKLRKLIPHGIAFHHAGLTYDDRRLIEENFRSGLLMALLCTSTLAMGLNLPAHLVIVKSTESYCRGSLEEYPESTLLQMIGRAGRPQYDTKGIAVILTHTRNVRKYENLMNGKLPVESHLHKHLAEHLNSEIALNTINNLEVAMNWIRSTYLYVRSVRNPVKYGLDGHVDTDIIEKKLEEMCLVQINALHSAGLVTRNIRDDLDVQTTAYGKLMAKYYLSFETMKLFRQIRGNESFLEILNMIVRCKEFSEFTVRVNEKKVLNELNSMPIRFPIRGRIKEREDKISCLIQAIFGNLSISSSGLAQESVKMIRIGDRIAKCLLEYLRLSENQLDDFQAGGGCYKALLHSVTIAKCFNAKLWENSDYAAKQLRKIGAVYSSLLANAGKTTLKSIGQTDARNIELILNKSYPFGDEVLQNLMANFPEYTLELRLKSADMIHISVKQINEEFVYNGSSTSIIVGDSLNNLLLFTEHIDSFILEYGFFEKTIKIHNLQVESINAHLIHTTLVGVDVHTSIVINKPSPQSEQDSTKKATKRKRQSKLTLSKIKKIDTNSDSTLGKEDTLDISAIPDDSFLIGLQKLSFSKPKLPSSKNTNLTLKPPAEVTQTSFKPKFINNFDNVPSRLNVTNITNINYNSVLVQKKVTEYYTSKRQYSASTTKSNECEIMTIDDSNNSLENKTSQCSVKENCDSDILEAVDYCIIQNHKKPLDLSKKKNDITHTQKQAKNTPPNYNERYYDVSNSSNVITPDRLNPDLNDIDLKHLSLEENHNKFDLSLISQQCATNSKQQAHNSGLDSLNFSLTSASAPNITETKIDREIKLNITNFDDTLISSPPEDNEDFIKSMYRVTKEFLKQNPVLHTYSNFKRIYHKIMTKNKDLKSVVQEPNLCLNGTSCTKNKKSNNLPSSSRNANSKPPTRGITNPFRLQLFEKDENVGKFSPSTVNSINRSVMNYVLHTKCELDENNNNQLDEINEISFFSELEEQLQLNDTQSNRPLTFEDYCRLFLDGNMPDL